MTTAVALAAMLGVAFGLMDLSWVALGLIVIGIGILVGIDVTRTDRPSEHVEHHHVTVVRRPPYDWEREE